MNIQQLCRRAFEFYQQGRSAEAADLCLKVLAREAANGDARHLLAVIRAQQGRVDDALEQVRAGLATGPDDVRLLEFYAYLLQLTERFEEALAVYDRLAAVAPGQAETLNSRGAALQSLRRLEEALASFDRALAAQPGHAGALYNRATVLMELNRNEEALTAFGRAVAMMPDYPEARNNRGAVLQKLGRPEKALVDFDRALALRPDYAEALFNRGTALDDLGRPQEALASFEKALAARPDFAEAWNKRGFLLQQMRQFEPALASYDQALQLRPGYGEALKNKASALIESGRTEEGFATFTRHAELALGRGKIAAETAPVHKARHDAEQRAYLNDPQIDVESALHLADGSRIAGRAINPDASGAIGEQWRTAKPQLVVIDNLLTPEAFDKMRRFCLGSTVWKKFYEGGYLGALPEYGFAPPLLGQIADELSAAYPAIFGGHALHYLWGFKYDSTLSGIKLHADKAAVNVNFWLTPDEANLDPQSGGLVVWDVAAPQDWDFRSYNGDTQASRDFLSRNGAKSVTIPYRANRAVIFDSDLFHETDKITFRDGYLYRRINVTLLYGRRTSDNR